MNDAMKLVSQSEDGMIRIYRVGGERGRDVRVLMSAHIPGHIASIHARAADGHFRKAARQIDYFVRRELAREAKAGAP